MTQTTMTEGALTDDGLIAAGLCLARGSEPDLSAANTWLQTSVEVLPVHVPAGIVVDVGRLLLRRSFDAAASTPTGHARLDFALDRYDEHVIGRLMADRLLDAAADALAGRSAVDLADGIAVVLDEWVRRLGLTTDPTTAAAMRRVIRLPPQEIRGQGFAALAAPDGPADALADIYLAWVDGARRLGRLLTPTEIYTLRHLDALRGAAQRLALRQIDEAAARFRLPKKVRRRRSAGGHSATMPDDDSAYPIGGYSALATTGGLSNLVSSELIYMDDDVDIDAFAIRWAGGELLKYTRDESVFRRAKRRIDVVCRADLDGCRIKPPGEPTQRIVLALGAVIAGIEALIRWLDRVALHINLVVESNGAADPLAGERALLYLRLQTWIDADILTFDEPIPDDTLVIEVGAAQLGSEFAERFQQTLLEWV